MTFRKFKFTDINDVSFQWVEQLYQDSYKSDSCFVSTVIRAKSASKPWHDIRSDESPEEIVFKLHKEGFKDVRLAVKVPNGYNYINIPIHELHINFEYPNGKIEGNKLN